MPSANKRRIGSIITSDNGFRPFSLSSLLTDSKVTNLYPNPNQIVFFATLSRRRASPWLHPDHGDRKKPAWPHQLRDLGRRHHRGRIAIVLSDGDLARTRHRQRVKHRIASLPAVSAEESRTPAAPLSPRPPTQSVLPRLYDLHSRTPPHHQRTGTRPRPQSPSASPAPSSRTFESPPKRHPHDHEFLMIDHRSEVQAGGPPINPPKPAATHPRPSTKPSSRWSKPRPRHRGATEKTP